MEPSLTPFTWIELGALRAGESSPQPSIYLRRNATSVELPGQNTRPTWPPFRFCGPARRLALLGTPPHGGMRRNITGNSVAAQDGRRQNQISIKSQGPTMLLLQIIAAILFLSILAFLPIISVVGCIRIVVLFFNAGRDSHRRHQRDASRQTPPRTTRTETVHKRPPLCLEALGLTASATSEEIIAAYRRLALALHPDRGGDPDEFKRLHRDFEQAMAYVKGKLRHTRC